MECAAVESAVNHAVMCGGDAAGETLETWMSTNGLLAR